MTDSFFLIKAAAIGLITGLFSGAFGIGGGILSIPLLRLILNVAPHVVIGTTLATIVPTAITASFIYSKQKLLSWRLAALSAIPAIFAAIIGSQLASFVAGKALMLCLSLLMVAVGLDFCTGVGQKLRKAAADNAAVISFNVQTIIMACLIGTAVGLLSGLLGIGGGILLIPCYCYFFRLATKVAFGTSLVVVAAVTIPSTYVYSSLGHVDVRLVASMLAGSLPGVWLGSKLMLRLKERYLNFIFGILLLLLAMVFAYKEMQQ